MASLKVAVIGQSAFGLEVYKLLRQKGHEVVGVFTIPDVNGKADVLGAQAEKDGVPVFKFKAWRAKATGQVLPGVFESYKSVNAQLNVLPFCSQFIPMEVINHPKHKSIIYHPSILPRHRGASAINWYATLNMTVRAVEWCDFCTFCFLTPTPTNAHTPWLGVQ